MPRNCPNEGSGDGNAGGGSGDLSPFNNNNNQQPVDLFAGNNSKGEWYFANSSLKSRGFNEFKSFIF